MNKTVNKITLNLTDDEKNAIASGVNALGAIIAEYSAERNSAEEVTLDPAVFKAVEALKAMIETLSK